jgi:4-alpha-glucanotransferase
MPESHTKEYLLNSASKDKWERIGIGKRAGVLVPLFSVYSRDSLGIGELHDIKLLVDWCTSTGNTVLQLLPMNETGSVYCPYDSVSSFALEPVYISLQSLPEFKKKYFEAKIQQIRGRFPTGRPFVDYGIKEEKTGLLREAFLGTDSYNSSGFKRFAENNAYWLFDFALYKSLKNHHSGRAWWEWGEGYAHRDTGKLAEYRLAHEKEILFHMWVQWLLYTQFKDVKEYAASKQVFIKGDLPILVSKDSADVWAHPEFFKLGFAAGAPPDMYCAKGQRWGMPTYNWEKIESDGFRYLKEKLKAAEAFYDILRIDHVVGLFRIWSIPSIEPEENHGLHGFFDPAHENVWKEHGRKILSVIIHTTKMLLCAEDLGMIPKSCTETLKELAIPGNEVQRWVKDWTIRHDFLPPQEYRVLSVAMLSTHDTTTWAAWWENEAGTVDEALFIRKCAERGIDYSHLKGTLFDMDLSRHGRLRWLRSVSSVETLTHILARRKEDVGDFIDMYNNTYQEKEKLWKHLRLSGPMREKCDADIVRAILKLTLGSRALFCIELIIDWLYPAGIFQGDAYHYRINTPGTVASTNWSLTIPIPLEELLNHKINGEIKEMIAAAGR